MGRSWVYKYQVGRNYTIKGKKYHVVAEGTETIKGKPYEYARIISDGMKKAIKIRNYPGHQYRF